MAQIVFKREYKGGAIALPVELEEFLELEEGTIVEITADSKGGNSLKLWNGAVPRPEKKKAKKN